jgi:membrane associated rhomboid family serine protease
MYLTDQWQRHTQQRRIYDFLRRHLISTIITLICLILFIGINSEPTRGSLNAYIFGNSEPSQDLLHALFRWGAPPTTDIRNGHLWGLITCNLLEPEPLWFFFSLLWLWSIGRFIEQRVSRLFYLWLIISTCIFASVMQIAICDRSHYGFAAIIYSMFGFIWVNSISDSSTWRSKPDIGILFLLWAAICFVFTYTEIYKVAYFTFFFGFIWGALLAYLGTLRVKFLYFDRIGRMAIPLLLLGLCSVSIFWAPWSIDWLSYKATKYHTLKDYDHAESMYLHILGKDQKNKFAQQGLQSIRIKRMSDEAANSHKSGDYDQAKGLYLRILEEDPNNEFAQQGLKSIHIKEMSDEAFNYHNSGDYDQAKGLYLRILEEDPNNEFAKENLQRIQIAEMSDEAYRLSQHGDLGKTRNICLDILKIDPNNEWARKCTDILSGKKT